MSIKNDKRIVVGAECWFKRKNNKKKRNDINRNKKNKKGNRFVRRNRFYGIIKSISKEGFVIIENKYDGGIYNRHISEVHFNSFKRK